ncbi:MAG: PIG-L family deacetylase, partial [Holophagales bacterium]|nr:PIG-L family deacetylase [Holophagales bacterium]
MQNPPRLPFRPILGLLSALLAAAPAAPEPAASPAPGAGLTVRAEHGAITGIDPLKPAGTRGLEAVDRALARLSGHRRILMIAAHPDDEDTFVLALAARGWGAEAAYLSLSRGEG